MKTDGDLIYYESLAMYLTFNQEDYAEAGGLRTKKL